MADLITFSFSQTTVILGIGGPVSSTFNYGRGDLTAFSATLAPNGVPTGLSLTTRAVSGSNPEFAPESFAVTSLLTDGACTFNASGTRLTGGTVAAVVAPAVPEPSALILTATGCAAGLAYAWRHRRHLAVA